MGLRVESLEIRNLLTTVAVDLANLQTAGTTFYGIESADLAGRFVSGIGDINGDGYDDVMIGALNSSGAGNNAAGAGEAYIIFGKSDWSGTPSMSLADVNGTNGFMVYGTDSLDRVGSAATNAGDLNGDGFDDLVIGAYNGDGSAGNKSNSGETYVIFGKASWSATPVVNISALNGTNGFTLYGIDAGDQSGKVVSGAGDVNGDGFADLIVAAPGGDASGNAKVDAGESYVVFGKADWSATPSVALSALNGTNGFTLFGADSYDSSGKSVSGAGDVNGDGFADLLIGAPDGYGAGNLTELTGEAYLIFGKANWSPTPTINLGALTPATGITFFGVDKYDTAGSAVSNLGDVNGDGFDDFAIAAVLGNGAANATSYSGETYVIFGKSNWSAAPSLSLASLNGTNGFTLYGIDNNDFTGTAVSGLGDVNADGYDDILMTAVFASGQDNLRPSAGESYVVYGKASWTATPSLVLSALDGTNGFTIFGAEENDQSGKSGSAAGDVNGDGFADILIGAHVADGPENAILNVGEAYFVFGGDFTASATQIGTPGIDPLNGTAGVDRIVGGAGNDSIVGNGGADVLYGGQGDDIITVSTTDFFRVDGGTGDDTLRLGGGGLTLDLTTLGSSKLRSIELIDIRGSGANTLILNQLEVLNLTKGSNPSRTANTLRVRRDSGDTVTMGPGWAQGANVVQGGITYKVFTQGAARLLVEDAATTPAGITLGISQGTITEAGGTATVTATLLDPANGTVTIDLNFAGSATFPSDYSRSAGQIVIQPGNSSGSITITSVQDAVVEFPETIAVSITSVSNGLEFSSNAVSVQIIDDDNQAPSFTSSATPSVPEGTAAVMTVTATDTDVPAQTITYSITGGADQALFQITGDGVLSFKTAPDFENPTDAGANNTYDVQVTATDSFGAVAHQDLQVTVTDILEAPEVNLTVGGAAATWVKKDAPVTVLPQVTVSSNVTLNGGTLTVSMAAVGKKKALDMLTAPSSTGIGSASQFVFADGKLTLQVELGAGATTAAVQNFLRGIKFSTKGKGLKTPTRAVTVTITEPTGSSDSVTQTINVRKK